MRRPTYSMLDELMASPTEPLSAEKRQHQLVRMFAALDNLVRAESPTKEDWRLCSGAVNMVESLIDMGICEDNSGLLMDAITALAKAGKRNLEGKPIRLDGQGLTAVRGILQDYADLLEIIPARVMIRCHRKTEKRIFEILAGRKQPHDVEIVSR
jgi:hypothetical protein